MNVPIQGFDKFHTNSPNFQAPADKSTGLGQRRVYESLVPSPQYKKQIFKNGKIYNVDFQKMFQFRAGRDIYKTIITDARSTLIFDETICANITIDFNNNFINNLERVYNNSARFFREEFISKDEEGKPIFNQVNFEKYEKYIFLLNLLVYINSHKETIQGILNNNAAPLISWAQLRYDYTIPYKLHGPEDSYDFPNNYKSDYELIISPAHDLSNLLSQNQLAKIGSLFNEVINFRVQADERPNSYDKTLDLARQYFIVIQDEKKLRTEMDDNNNLVFDASYIDIGDPTQNVTQANYNEIIVSQDKYESPPSRMLYKSIQQMFTNFNSITIQELSFDYGLFNTDLSKFTNIYLIFSGIETSKHTIIGELPRGRLYISGKFRKNISARRYEFVPSEDITTFDGSQSSIKSFKFYISDIIEGKNAIDANNLTIHFNKDQIFNHLLGVSNQFISDSVKIKVNEALTTFYIPNLYSEWSDDKRVGNLELINRLKYKPLPILNFLKNIVEYKARYDELLSEIEEYFDKPITEITNSELAISDEVDSYRELMDLQEVLDKFTKIINDINTILYEEKLTKLELIDTDSIYKSLVPLSENPNYQEFLKRINVITNVDVIKGIYEELCKMNTNELITVSESMSLVDMYMEYANLIQDINFALLYPIVITSDIKMKDTNEMNLFAYNYSNNQVIYVGNNENSSAEFNYLKSDENNLILIQFYNNEAKNIPNSSYIFEPNSQIIQRYPGEEINPLSPQNIEAFDSKYVIYEKQKQDSIKNYCMFGGNKQVSMGEVNKNNSFYYASVTEKMDNYFITNIRYPNAVRTVDFVTYLPYGLITQVFDFKEFDEDNEIVKHVTVQSDGSYKLENVEDNVSMSDSYMRLSNEYYNFGFAIENGKVSSIDICFINPYNNHDFVFGSLSLNAYVHITLGESYTSSCMEENVFITSREEKIDLPENIDVRFSKDNVFKAWKTNENLIQRYWNTDYLINGILLNSLKEDKYEKLEKIELSSTDSLSFDSRTNQILYQINKNGNKVFYNTISCDGTNLNTTLVDGKESSEPFYVLTHKTGVYSTNLSGRQRIQSEITVLSLQIEEEFFDSSIVMTCELTQSSNIITNVKLSIGENFINIKGIFESDTFYFFDLEKIIPEIHNIGAISINYTIENNTLYVYSIQVYVTDLTLIKYEWNEDILEKRKLYHFYKNFLDVNNYSIPNSNELIEVSPIKGTVMKKTVPHFKYYQNNLISQLYTNNNNLQMTINQDDSFPINSMINIQNSESLDLCPTISKDNKHNIENIANKIVISNVDNQITNSENAIYDETGILSTFDNGFLYLSMNIK